MANSSSAPRAHILVAHTRFSHGADVCRHWPYSFVRSPWQWDDVPTHPLLAVGDLPKPPQRVPRYIPDAELARLMDAIRALDCPLLSITTMNLPVWRGITR
jgi:hypothetical protein